MSDTTQDTLPRSTPAWKWKDAFRIGPDLIPILFAFAASFWFTVELPRSDDWQLVPVIERFRAGTADFAFLAAPFNQHVMLVSYPVMAALAMATHWNTVVMQMAGMVFYLVGWLAFRADGRHGPWRLLLAALFFWGLHQYGNFLWMWQIACLLSFAMVFWALRLVSAGAGGGSSRIAFAGALALAWGASLSYGMGLCVWPALLFVLAVQREWRRFAAAGLALLVLGALFFRGAAHAGAGEGEGHGGLLHVLAYFFTMWGSPLAPLRYGLAAACGVAGFLLFLWTMRKGDPFIRAMGVFGVAGMALVTYSRCTESAAWSLAANSRYGILAMLAWLPVLFLLPARGWRVGLLVLLGLMVTARSAARVRDMDDIRKASLESAYALRHHLPGGTALRSSQTDEEIARYAALLEEWRYSVFRKGND
ncbi:MAG TPA: hypothetical protein VIM58_07955 [Candidatus Methylacidiphilales bacterium]